jgi:uncharacterized OsmC-like protein
MTARSFHFRLRSSHLPPERATTNLVVELHKAAGQWEPQQLSFSTPGFRIYLISLLLCQHFYLVANAQEKRIPLERVEADFVVTTSSDWIVAAVEGDFRIRLDAAASAEEHQLADAEAIAFMQERMKLCPISRNLPEHVHKRIALSAEPSEPC